MYTIRRATQEDARAIAYVHVESWRTTYKPLLEEEDIQSLTLENRITLWETILKTPINNQTIFVATDETDRVVGFISGGKERTKVYGYDGEIYAIYLLDEVRMKGLGTELLKAFTNDMAQKGYGSILVWVLTRNPNKRFYERYGAIAVEAENITIGKGTYEETAYGWKHLDHLLETLPASS
ncbi:GNAT family N-acetyltransferase [Pontibacillus salipaludis]|uniref:N-acetyltransferase n=1 Tax=Pontibacillus salipaludis TaxID=1697394 RepID=A0ABQ1QEN0_9BACI|nr:GNAT family N-acetyltransferase [Pontibacillus salipaludis]GGD23572.1 N-acetyltransferase [Pontibacillus salipaludis]